MDAREQAFSSLVKVLIPPKFSSVNRYDQHGCRAHVDALASTCAPSHASSHPPYTTLASILHNLIVDGLQQARVTPEAHRQVLVRKVQTRGSLLRCVQQSASGQKSYNLAVTIPLGIVTLGKGFRLPAGSQLAGCGAMRSPGTIRVMPRTENYMHTFLHDGDEELTHNPSHPTTSSAAWSWGPTGWPGMRP